MIIGSCSEEFLEIYPNGELNQAVLANYEGVDGLLIGAYSMLDGVAEGVGGWESTTSGWVFASIRALEANKGTDSGDAPQGINSIQTYCETGTNPYLNIKWGSCYESINRCNSVLRTAHAATDTRSIRRRGISLSLPTSKGLKGILSF